MVRSGVSLVRFWSDPQMSLNDSKIRKLKPSSRLVKLSDSHGLYLLVNPAVHASGISNIVSTEKNPESVLAHTRLSHWQKPGNSATVSVSYWRRISTRRSSAWRRKRPAPLKSALRQWRWPGTKPTKNGRLIMPPVFSPVWKTISSRRLVICQLPLLKRRIYCFVAGYRG